MILLAFPVASGVLLVALHAGPPEARLVQATAMRLSVVVVFIYCRIKRISRAALLLASCGVGGETLHAGG